MRCWFAMMALIALVGCLSAPLTSFGEDSAKRKVVFLAGGPSHDYGSHEHYAGCLLLAKSLQLGMPDFEVTVHPKAWPQDPQVFADADAIVMYADGGNGHPVLPHLEQVDALAKQGVGIICLHYAVEVPKGEPGAHFLDWIGGYFETHWSVNPHWTANFESLPEHPVTRGVEPFAIEDEWYYHMRFREEMKDVTPILSAVPPASTLDRPDGPHSGNPHVRATVGQIQHVAWAAERPGGGRGFGFTGGHFHWNWGDPNFRKVVLNAIVWAAHGEVPQQGVSGNPLSLADLEANQDSEPPAGFDRERIRTRLNLPADDAADAPDANEGTQGKDGGARSGTRRRRPRPVFASKTVTSQTPGHAVAIDADIRGAKQLHLVVTDGGNGYGCDWADWAEPRLVGPQGEKRLTELSWKSGHAEWGEPRMNRNAGGGPLRIAGQSVEYGIGTHANSIISFDLPPGYTRFVARGGLDNGGTDQAGCGGGASVQFLVYTRRPQISTQVTSDGDREPSAAVSGLDVAEGLEATLFASEPVVQSLTNLDIDHRGRIWVCEVVNYRKHLGKRSEGDRILILEDTDGDGRADQHKVFYQGTDVDSAMGICVLGNKVIVSASPQVLVFTDENGDDVPDRKEVLFSNTGQPQHDHSAHSFLFGPDGYLYWNFGNTGQQVCDAEGKLIVDLAGNEVIDNGKPYYGGMPFRCRIDGSGFEVLAHNFRNNYEVTVDSFGNLWQSDNDDDGNRGVRINFVMEFGNYGYKDELTGAGWQSPRTNMEPEIPLQHWHLNDPGVVPNLLQTGAGSPTGITIYEGRLLPKIFWDQIIHCDAGPSIVRSYPVERQGAGYQADIVNLVHGARDNWFRPADVCVAPDGSVFITDWYDPGVGGHNMGDLDRGRIFRIAPPGHQYRVPSFDFETVTGAVEALANPNLATRYLAYTALQQMGDKAEEALARMYRENDNPRLQARALWLLGQLPDRGQHYIQAGLQNSHPDLRIVALRLARRLNQGVADAVRQLAAKETDMQVLRECAIALRHCDHPQQPELWAQLAQRHDGQDRWYLEALGIGAELNWDACLDAWLKKAGQAADSPAARDIIWRSRSSKTPLLLAMLIGAGSEHSGPLPRYFRAMDYQSGENKSEALRKLAFATDLPTADKALIVSESLSRLNPAEINAPEYRQALEEAIASMAQDAQYVTLVGRFNVESQYPRLLQLALEHAEDSLGVEAVRLLLVKEQGQLFRKILEAGQVDQALSVVRALDTAADAAAVPLLLELATGEQHDLELRRRATAAAAKSVNGARQLITMAQQGKLPESLKQSAAAALNASADEQVRVAAAELFPLPASKDDTPLPSIQELLKLSGSAERGQKVFATHGQCANCHRVGETGKEVGPALTEIGSKLSRQAMFETILFPSAGISHNYETYAVELEDGNLVTGVLVSRTDDQIVVKTQDAIVRQFASDEVAMVHKLNVSLMPADLQKAMTVQELVDVVDYLSTLQTAAP